VVSRGDAELGLEHPAEMPFGEVDPAGEGGHGEVAIEVVAQPRQKFPDGLGVGALCHQQRGELGLATRSSQVDHEMTSHARGRLVTVVLIGFGSPVRDVLDWIWPPVVGATVVLVVVRARRELRSSVRHRLLYPVLAVLALASMGGGYETVREAADAAAYPMPGRLIDVGGHGLHLNCTGSGGPTVVLEAGGGEMWSNLGWVAPGVARETRVCVYDRAGRGWSEPADTIQDGAQIAADLHTLLRRAQVPGPYVLAGHSFGGLYVLAFAAR
jgi:hypothetical protein